MESKVKGKLTFRIAAVLFIISAIVSIIRSIRFILVRLEHDNNLKILSLLYSVKIFCCCTPNKAVYILSLNSGYFRFKYSEPWLDTQNTRSIFFEYSSGTEGSLRYYPVFPRISRTCEPGKLRLFCLLHIFLC